MSKSISRTPLFWLIFTAVSILSAAFTYNYFSTTFPTVSIDLKMDRQTALEKAAELSRIYNWGPNNFQEIAAFNVEADTKNYIELEGGDREKLNEIIQEKYYSLYQWIVRHFQENNSNETLIYFTPEGTPYGFHEKLDQKAEGAALTAEQARNIAEQQAQTNWDIDFNDYELVEESQVTQPSKRIDHIFIYEKKNTTVGQAPYRLKLGVSGDTFTELTLDLKIPEGFTRRYEHMRSANNTIATAAQLFLALIYFLGGCILGLWLLLKKNYVLWKHPLFWGSFLGFLQAANSINQWPLHWFSYDTALSTGSFTANFLLQVFILFTLSSAMFTIIIAAAESLTRKAFGSHPQLWKVWSPQAAPTTEILGRTISGYLLPTIKLAYIIIFYFITQKYFGWWSPAETLMDPNTLSAYVPWFSSVSQALTAGFWEECMFRAVPLAGAALLGRRFGKEKLCIAIAFLVQALVFGAGHANYPAQPAYARVVELILSSCMFGYVYLRYGLLPSIITHFVYDAILMSLPIFISIAPGIWVQQSMAILATSIPVLILFYYRFLSGAWHSLPEKFYNFAWQAPTIEKQPYTTQKTLHVTSIAQKLAVLLLVFGLSGFCLWGLCTKFNQDTTPISISRTEALSVAQQYARQENINLDNNWHAHSFIKSTPTASSSFIWQTAGKTLYHQLSNRYLMPPSWVIRYTQQNGDIEQRAEEYRFYITNSGSLYKLEHIVPENQSAPSLTEEDARSLAHNKIQQTYALSADKLKEISAESKKQPNRKDWIFIFEDTTLSLPENGQARIHVTIAGDTTRDMFRTVFVPEPWERTKRQNDTLFQIISIICMAIFALLMACALSVGFWHHFGISWRVTLIFAGILLAKSLLQMVNLWPTLTAQFSTSQPFYNQALMVLTYLLISSLSLGIFYSFIAGFTKPWQFSLATKFTQNRRIVYGITSACTIIGALACIQNLLPQTVALWADNSILGAYNTPINIGFTSFTLFIHTTIFLLLTLGLFDTLSRGWHTRKIITILGFVLFGISIAGMSITTTESIALWLIVGCAQGLLLCLAYVFVIRFDRAIVPIFSATIIFFSVVENSILVQNSSAILGIFFAILLIGAFSWWWSQLLVQE